MPALAENRRARFDYEIVATYMAGIELKGFEVKAVKSGKMGIAGTFVVPQENELYLLNADIPPYQPNNTPEGYDQKRSRRLLLNKKEINEIKAKIKGDRLTIVPIKVYTKRGFIKIEIALVRGKKKYDKRDTIKKRDTKREMDRSLRKN